MVRIEFKDAAATIGWAIVLASVVSQSLYVKDSLNELEFVLVFIGSVVAGAVLADVEKLILSFVVTIASFIAITYFCLNLPVILQFAIAGEALAAGTIVNIFRGVFPIPVIIILLGGLLGSFVGEKLRLF